MGRSTKRKKPGDCQCGAPTGRLDIRYPLCPQCREKVTDRYRESYRPRKRALTKRKRIDRLLKNLCADCGNQAPEEGRTLCSGCLDYYKRLSRSLYQARKEAGLCMLCSGRSRPGKILCGPCQERGVAATKRSRERRKQGLTPAGVREIGGDG